jgi:hypothetical protein
VKHPDPAFESGEWELIYQAVRYIRRQQQRVDGWNVNRVLRHVVGCRLVVSDLQAETAGRLCRMQEPHLHTPPPVQRLLPLDA